MKDVSSSEVVTYKLTPEEIEKKYGKPTTKDQRSILGSDDVFSSYSRQKRENFHSLQKQREGASDRKKAKLKK